MATYTYTESGLYYYKVTYTAGATTFSFASGDTNTNNGISIGSDTPVLYLGSGDVEDTTLTVSNVYVGTVNVGGTTGFLVEDTQGGVDTYYVFLTAKLTTIPGTTTTYTVNKSTGATDPHADNWNMSSKGAVAYCFMAGTAIQTPSGNLPVETLKAGDLVTLSDGRTAPISWLGIQTVSMVFADPLRVAPVRIKAGALGDNLPVRDLLISPDHALLVDGILAQAGALVNDVSIIRETSVPVLFTYYHVEVTDHSLILAEGVPAETFIDNVNRMGFDNWAEHQTLVGDATIAEMQYPRAKAARQVPQATRSRLSARAEALFGTERAAA